MVRKIQSAPIWKAAIGTVDLRLRAGGCARGAKPQAEAEGEEAVARTEFTERIENFFEYEPLKAESPVSF